MSQISSLDPTLGFQLICFLFHQKCHCFYAAPPSFPHLNALLCFSWFFVLLLTRTLPSPLLLDPESRRSVTPLYIRLAESVEGPRVGFLPNQAGEGDSVPISTLSPWAFGAYWPSPAPCPLDDPADAWCFPAACFRNSHEWKGAFNPQQVNFHHCLPSASLSVVWKPGLAVPQRETQITSGNQHARAVGSRCIASQGEKPWGKIWSWGPANHLCAVEYNHGLNLNPTCKTLGISNCFSWLQAVTRAAVFQPRVLCWGCKHISLPMWWH